MIPELLHSPDKGAKSPSSVGRQDAGDVLPYQPFGPMVSSDGKIGEHEVATRVSKSSPESGDAEGLTGRSANEEPKRLDCLPLSKSGDVSKVPDLAALRDPRNCLLRCLADVKFWSTCAEPVVEDVARKRLDLGERDRRPA